MRTSVAAILLATFLAPAAVYAASSDNAGSNAPVRISTGVIAPAVMNSGNFSVTADALNGVYLEKPSVELALRVNEKGLAENVHVVRSVSSRVDAQVLEAVREFRFKPAMLDQQPVPVDLHLTVLVQR